MQKLLCVVYICQVLDVSNKSIEETASLVMQLIDKNRASEGKMNIREQIEEREALLLSLCTKSRDAIRDLEEAPDSLRTAFQRDRDRIISQ